MAYDKKPAQDEIIYPDKEITDDVLIAAGMLERSRETIDDKGAATQEPVIVEKKYAEPIKEETVVIEQPAEQVEPAIVSPEVTYEDVPAPEKDKTYIEQPDDTVYPDVPSPVASGTEELDAFGAMYADALDKKKSKKSRKEKKGKKDKYSIDELAAYDSMMESDLSHKKAEKDSELESFGKEYEEKKDLKSVRVDEQQKIALGDAEIEVDPALIQYDQQEKNDNDASLIVKIFYKEDEWLLPGDIEKDAIEIWLGENTQTFDILKMPHHGGREKNTKELLDNTEPEIAVITDSVLEEVPEKVLKQLEKRDITVYRSSVNGTITIRGDGTGTYDVTSEK
jgi:hypothetical protein